MNEQEIKRKIQNLAIECDDTYSMANRVEDCLDAIFESYVSMVKTKNQEIAKYQIAIQKQSKRADALKQLCLDKDVEIARLKKELPKANYE